MTVYIEKDGDDEAWSAECSPACMTDITVIVRRRGDEEYSLSFNICELMREEIENWGDWVGMLQLDDNHLAVFNRWADQLEITACLMRSALRSRIPPSPNPVTAPPQQDPQ